MTDSYIQLSIGLAIALLGSAGFWGYMRQRFKVQTDLALAGMNQLDATNKELRAQVLSLTAKVDTLLEERQSLSEAITELKAALAEARVTITHLEAKL